jgi:short-subunit dehydrogenase
MKQNTAIITGASEGIGAALTKLLIQHEWKVIGLSRNLEKLKLLQNNLCENKDSLSITLVMSKTFLN